MSLCIWADTPEPSLHAKEISTRHIHSFLLHCMYSAKYFHALNISISIILVYTYVTCVQENDLFTLYLIEMSFNAFANRAGPDQAALVRAA